VLNRSCQSAYGCFQRNVICFRPLWVKPVIWSYPSRLTTSFDWFTKAFHV